MKQKLLKYFPAFLVVATPLFALAQVEEGRNFKDVVFIFIDLLRLLMPILVILAGIMFAWGVALFVFRVGGDEKAVENGKSLMFWGIIALFVMTSLWAIVALISGEFGWGFGGLPFLEVNSPSN